MPATDASTDLLYAIEDWIGIATINRPHARNALTMPMYARLAEICRGLEPGGPVKALIIRGAGGKAFASGTDIAEFAAFTTGAEGVAYETGFSGYIAEIEACRVPTIAAIAGACTGGGAAIAAVADLRLTTADLRFGFPIARTLGNTLGASTLAKVVALIGPARTTDLLFQARLMGAEEALRIGLVSEVVADADALDDRAHAIAREVASLAPLTLFTLKETLRRIMGAGGAAVENRDMVDLAYGSADFREGRDAFLARRPPVWRGK